MAAITFFTLLLLVLSSAAHPVLGFTRSDFPPDFVFGAATSAYQGKWQIKAQATSLLTGTTNDDVKLMADTNLEAYRLSISWSRLIPDGRGAVNPKGLEYYNDLIDELVKHGIQVHVMLCHLDFPQVLDDEYGGWLSPTIVDDFTAFADVCFKEFGDRVSYWTTIDEPNVSAIGSYDSGLFAPGHCSDPFGISKCSVGNSTVEPYMAAHNMIMAHASATRLYREKYRAVQMGGIGINVYSSWSYPLTTSNEDKKAAKRYLDFVFGWILEPFVSGDYPKVMKKNVGARLPSFTNSQSQLVKGAIDFVGINHYYSIYVNDRPLDKGTRDYAADMSVYQRASRTKPPSGKYVPSSSPSDPEGLQFVLQYLTEAYGNLPIYVQENGNASNDTLDDTDRVEYLKTYMDSTLKALRNGAKVKGYFVWAFLDVFEFLAGYQSRYGLYLVDFDDEALPRQARLSARWYSAFLKNNGIYAQKRLDSTGTHVQQ